RMSAHLRPVGVCVTWILDSPGRSFATGRQRAAVSGRGGRFRLRAAAGDRRWPPCDDTTHTWTLPVFRVLHVAGSRGTASSHLACVCHPISLRMFRGSLFLFGL